VSLAVGASYWPGTSTPVRKAAAAVPAPVAPSKVVNHCENCVTRCRGSAQHQGHMDIALRYRDVAIG